MEFETKPPEHVVFENPDWSVNDENPSAPLELPAPEPKLYLDEENRFRKELLKQAEEACKAYHPNLRFYPKDTISEKDLAVYTLDQAQKLIQATTLLNEEQKAAVLACTENLGIHSLAGTGKTSSLSACIAYLIAQGTPAEEICVCSHTVTAAEEIKSRIPSTIQKLFPELDQTEIRKRPEAGTIHALARRELVKFRHPKGRCLILEESAQYKIWQEARKFAAQDLDDSEATKIDNALKLFDRIRGWDIPEDMVIKALSLVAENGVLTQTAKNYQIIKDKRNLIDYTDLLRHWISLVVHPAYQGKWRYIFVDEFQDTSPLQKFILTLLAKGGTKVIVCGDNLQSINSFSGSDPSSDEPFFRKIAAKECWLETNYRCSPEVLEVANHVLSRTHPRLKHRLKGANPPSGYPVTVQKLRNYNALNDDEAEARTAAEIADELKHDLSEKLGREASVAILYRTNNQGGQVEEQIIELNKKRRETGTSLIQYLRKDYRRTAMRQRVERELLACLTPFSQTEKAPWTLILSTPYFPGIGEVTAQRIQKKSERKNEREYKATSDLWYLFENEIPRKTAEIVGNYLEAIETALNLSDAQDGEENKITCQAAYSAFQAWAKLSSSPETKKQKSTKAEIEDAQRRTYEATLLSRLSEGKDRLLKDWILEQHTRLDKETETGNEQTSPEEENLAIILSTIHLAKGKEYDGVVIVGLHRGSLPHFNALHHYKSPENTREKQLRKYISHPQLQKATPEEEEIIFADPESQLPPIRRQGFAYQEATTPLDIWDDWNNPLEEERRLLYVGITRAKSKLVLLSRAEKHPFFSKEAWEALEEGQPLR
jgi:DNA helicase-2/ATP-dependent DNA helicase PcrA